MNKTFIIIMAFQILAASRAMAAPDKAPCWYSIHGEVSEHRACVERAGKEKLRVRRSHLRHMDFDGDFATLLDQRYGWMYVNKKGEVVVEHVMPMDNGADYIRDGFVRYERNGKCGYADLSGARTIIPQFDGCMPFEDGVAHVCNGCRIESDGEYQEYKGGDSFCIDIKGQRIRCAP